MIYIIFVVWAVLMIRNTSVLYAGLTVLDRAGLAGYDKLPSYGEMFLNPKYWLLWTGEHWLAWIDRKSKQACNFPDCDCPRKFGGCEAPEK